MCFLLLYKIFKLNYNQIILTPQLEIAIYIYLYFLHILHLTHPPMPLTTQVKENFHYNNSRFAHASTTHSLLSLTCFRHHTNQIIHASTLYWHHKHTFHTLIHFIFIYIYKNKDLSIHKLHDTHYNSGYEAFASFPEFSLSFICRYIPLHHHFILF